LGSTAPAPPKGESYVNFTRIGSSVVQIRDGSGGGDRSVVGS
jgi:hypothetical protein